MSYEEIDGKVAIAKVHSFVFNFKLKKLQEEIARQELVIKKLREAKWKKLCEEMKPTIAESNIDAISLNDVQRLLQNKFEADVEDKKQKTKSGRAKKSAEKSSGYDNATDAQEENCEENFCSKNTDDFSHKVSAEKFK